MFDLYLGPKTLGLQKIVERIWKKKLSVILYYIIYWNQFFCPFLPFYFAFKTQLFISKSIKIKDVLINFV